MSTRIGLFGGTFNPIHFGHLISARAVAEHLGLTEVVFLPSARPPHKFNHPLIEAHHRAAMVRLAIEGEPGFAFSDHDLNCTGPSYTYDAVMHFKQQLGRDVELCWMVGADSLPDLGDWHRARELVQSCRIVAAARPGWEKMDLSRLRSAIGDDAVEQIRADVLPTPRIDISSTAIRERCQRGISIRFFTPDAVCAYIQDHQLYR